MSNLFRPVTTAHRTVSCVFPTAACSISCMSAEEVQGLTLKPSGLRLGPCNRSRARAVTVWHHDSGILSKILFPPATWLCCFVPTFLTLYSLFPLSMCGLGSFAVHVQPIFFFFKATFLSNTQMTQFQGPKPTDLSGLESKNWLEAVWEVDGSDEIRKHTAVQNTDGRASNLFLIHYFIWHSRKRVFCYSAITTVWVRCPEERLPSFSFH